MEQLAEKHCWTLYSAWQAEGTPWHNCGGSAGLWSTRLKSLLRFLLRFIVPFNKVPFKVPFKVPLRFLPGSFQAPLRFLQGSWDPSFMTAAALSREVAGSGGPFRGSLGELRGGGGGLWGGLRVGGAA